MAKFHYRGFKEETQVVLRKSSVYLLNSDKSKSFYQKTFKDGVSNARMENIEKVVNPSKEPKDFLTEKSLEYSSPVEDRRTTGNDHSFAGKNIVFSLMSPVWTLKREEKKFNHGSLFKNFLDDLTAKDVANAGNATDYDQEPIVDEKYSFILGFSLVGAVCFFVVNASKSNSFKSLSS